jgi:polar amino acid transport system substrate-binding protein
MNIGNPRLIARIVITILFWISGCGLPAAAEAVRIAYPQVFPPFTEFKNGKSEGLIVDIVRAAAARAPIDVEFVPVPFEQLQKTLEDGRADAVILTITPERLPLFDFSDSFLVTGGALFVRAPNATPENLRALSGKIVVTPRTGPLAAFIQKNAPDVKLGITTDYEESLARLIKGEADVAALGFHVAINIANRLYPGQVTLPRTMFTELPFAVAAIKGRGAPFLTQLDAGIAAIRADGSWQKINDRWTAN